MHFTHNVFFPIKYYIMTGGLINIVSYGLNDLYLTGAPQITFFKIMYRRYTNFSKESLELQIGDINFGQEAEIYFPKYVDAVGNSYLQFIVPQMNILRTDTGGDLTDEERSALEWDRDMPLTDEQILIVNDKQIVIDFMKINMAGYRVAVARKNITNQIVSDYIYTIKQALQYNDSLDSEYRNALQRALTYEISNNIYGNLTTLTYYNSDIKEVLNNINTDGGGGDGGGGGGPKSGVLSKGGSDNVVSTVDQVFELVQRATNISKDVMNYYFQKNKEYYDLDRARKSKYAKFAWVEKLGTSMIDRIDIKIGGERIDRHYGDWMNIWHELTSYKSQDELYDKMIGNVPEMITFNSDEKPKYILKIPLTFWFCKNVGLAFPMIALQYTNMSISIKLKKIDECAYIEKVPTKNIVGDPISILQLSLSDVWENLGLSINASIVTDVYYLDSLERKRFAQSAHEYLIETVQLYKFTETFDMEQSFPLDFDGPCKEIIWTAQKTQYIGSESTLKKHWDNYGCNLNKTKNGIISTNLVLHGYIRFKNFGSGYFNYLQPYYHHKRIPADGINIYSFSLYPEEHQPSSTCNFSVITNPLLNCTIDKSFFKYKLSDIDPSVVPNSEYDEELKTSIEFKIYAIRYNVLRIISGMAALAT